jgi:hypothetical protein
MSLLFDRNAKLIISETPQSTKGVDLSGLHFSFKIEKTTEPKPNTATIDVYNISQTTKAKLEQKNNVVILQVGYRGLDVFPKFETLFIGDITDSGVTVDRSGATIKYTFTAMDGIKKYKNAIINKSYSQGVTSDIIISDLANIMGLTISYIGVSEFKLYQHGYAASGKVSTILDEITKSINAEWSINNYELIITQKNKPAAKTAILISANTGLIGSVSKTEKGIQFKTLLNPKLQPFSPISVESLTIKGFYRIERVVHVGETSSAGEWISQVEAISL